MSIPDQRSDLVGYLLAREIGVELFLSDKTVKNYVSNLLGKLGMGRRSEAAAYAGRLAERRATTNSRKH